MLFCKRIFSGTNQCKTGMPPFGILANHKIKMCHYSMKKIIIVTVTCPLAESYVTGSAREAGAAAELAASRKEEKYANIGNRG